MDDRDVMAVDAADPPPAASLDLSPSDHCGPRRDSMEDADPSLTRKRQRLGSSPRSMSADALAALPDDAGLPDQAPDTPRSLPPAEPELPHTPRYAPRSEPSLSSHKRTASKVTINVRTPRLDPTSGASAAPAPPEPASEASVEDAMSSAAGTVGTPTPVDRSTVISPSSSPGRSPEVEIAEVEDMDQDYETSAWTPLVNVVSASLVESIPFYTNGCDPKSVVAQIGAALEKGGETNGVIIAELRDWFGMCVRSGEQEHFDWYEVYSEHQLFWDEVPNLIEGLLKRRLRFEGDFMRDPFAADEQDVLEDLFVQFSRLTLQLVVVDLKTLQQSRDSKDEPDLISWRYQTILSWTLTGAGADDVCLWHVLRKGYAYDVDDMVAVVALQFVRSPSNGLRHLIDYAKLLGERVAVCPKLAGQALNPVWIAQRLVGTAVDRTSGGLAAPEDEAAAWRQVVRDAALLCQATYQQLHHIVEKQGPLPRDFIKDACNPLSSVLFDVAQADPPLGRALLDMKQGGQEAVRADDLPQLVMRAWKLSLLKKCMVGGRMEVRAQGLELMSEDLLEAWARYSPKGVNQPVLQHLADFILKHDLVGYLVGVDSHLQLMDRSTNVVGFLVVTDRYTSQETDAIWRTVTTSQNPRVVAAVLGIFKGILSLAQYPTLIYLCQKLNEIPLRSFDATMIGYATAVLQHTRDKFRHIQLPRLDIQPYDLCIRLLREATASEPRPALGASAVSNFALKELIELMAWGPDADHRRRIYHECVRDIADKAPGTTGSVCVINALLGQHQSLGDTRADLAMLASELDLFRLLVDELDHSFEVERAKDFHQGALKHRLDLLAQLIVHESSTITPELAARFWDRLLGKSSMGPPERDAGWTMLCGVLNRIRSRNGFLDLCIHDYLPGLDPEHITPAVLGFTQQAIQYEHRLEPPRPACEHEIIEIAGSEQVWRIILGARSHSIAAQAIRYLVDLYLTAAVVERAPPSAVEATHLAIVDRCVRRLTDAATRLKAFADGTTSGEDEPMVIVASEAEIQAEELSFSRSILLLREILHRLRNAPRRSPRPSDSPELPPSPPHTDETLGETVQIRYQASSGSSQPSMKRLDIGDLATCEALRYDLGKVTGFSRFKLYCAGFQVDLDEDPGRPIRDLRMGDNPFIIINQIHERTTNDGGQSQENLTAVEIELLKHFDELYELLGLEEKLASEIWEFLNAFAPQGKARRSVLSETVTDVFPPGQPFKIMYSGKTLRTCLEEQLQRGIADEAFITHGVRAIVAALTSKTLFEGVSNHLLKIKVMSMLVDCLLRFMKEPVSEVTSASYFTDEPAIVACFMDIIQATRSPQTWSLSESESLACNSFCALLDASMHSATFWSAFTGRPDATNVIQQLLLDDLRVALREKVGQIIGSFCKVLPAPTRVTSAEFASYLWRVLSSILPHTTDKQANSAQFFDASLAVFRAVGESSRDSLNLAGYIWDWGKLLLDHKHEEIVGRDTVDHFIFGMTRMMYWCIQLARSYKQPVETGDLAEHIFSKYLFPELSPSSDEQVVVEKVPVLHSPTRHELNQLVLLLAQDPESYRKILLLLGDVVAEPSYNPVFQYQRLKWIRAPTGYVGLHNLSNTCYLNSLFTQLFMNVGFRGFMLYANVADADGSQRLLAQTQKLFAHMQNSWHVSVEPKDLAGSIRTYDDDNIDVTVQMDVDEFYNLLFDRWEGQILSDEAKKAFRSFYGGQLVQQVKSRECPHISEREEPFSAIQCDIKGKATLQDSLKAYVEGDIMEGDNKYSCTTCNRHVDAVKRTCLKEIPNNLIFHLKRFDFDLRQMQRSKINDHFAFPDTIDMKPYTVDHLSDPDTPIPDDVFELVGVLVHSGTAESGHYYSFIRERPITSLSQSPGWVQFNDSDVSSWDPANIAAQCFGGQESWPQPRDNTPLILPKAYSAYMLFYQRSSSLNAEQQAQESFKSHGPKKLEVPLELGNHIARDNELFIRKHCLYDPTHAPFVKSLLDSLRHINKGVCSESHELEEATIGIALQHVDSVVARVKDVPDFDGMMHSLLRVIGSCAHCCKFGLDWVSTNADAMRNLLLRCPVPKVRQEFARVVVTALQYLRDNAPSLYGLEITSHDPTEWTEGDGAFQAVLSRLDTFWGIMDCHMRSWDDYFGLLSQLALLGQPELDAVLHEGFLRRCLEVLVVESNPAQPPEYERMVRILAKGRKVSYNQLIGLVELLLGRIDLTCRQPVRDEYARRALDRLRPYPPTRAEDNCMVLHMRQNKSLVFLTKILDVNHNPPAARGILAQLVRSEPGFGHLHNTHSTLTAGIAIDPASLAGPYLEAAVVFCENAPASAEIKDIISRTAREVDTIGAHGGREHLLFFDTLSELENKRLGAASADFFHLRVLEAMQHWAPVLLVYNDAGVREDTETLSYRIAMAQGAPADTGVPALDETIDRCVRELGLACLSKMSERYVVPNCQVQAKSVEPISRVLERCRPFFEVVDDDSFGRKLNQVEDQVRELLVDEVDEASDEWDNDSNMATDSSDIDPTSVPMEPASP
ncbi:MAG: hypothetical protein M1832_000284 [Thelocarpon impressellum]|nr:MAG: hypothetical protein M1832_000284 [Thelocarpon impressellum]